MSQESPPPRVIYLIRHGEKPDDHAERGIDIRGKENEHSLLPRGWQRSGALAALFDPDQGPLRPGLHVPETLVSPSYGGKKDNARHRTHQTISGISDRLGIEIAADFEKGEEPQLAGSLVSSGPGPVLVCWDHTHIPQIASALPVVDGTVIPEAWPEDRYDLIWTFTHAADRRYEFSQLPQLLLPGDAGTIIT